MNGRIKYDKVRLKLVGPAPRRWVEVYFGKTRICRLPIEVLRILTAAR